MTLGIHAVILSSALAEWLTFKIREAYLLILDQKYFGQF